MVIASIRPSTVDGIKQLAKKIRREHNIPYTQALEDASRRAGYENFVHARRQLVGAGASRHFPVYLSAHWQTPLERNGNSAGLRAGREVLRVDLTHPLPEIVAKHRVAYGRGVSGFRMEYEDHLEHRTNVIGQEAARKALLTATRSLRFMEATGLQPVTTQKGRDLLRPLEKLPGRDHQSLWFDPVTEGYVFLDEPYAPALESVAAERQRWLERNDLHMVAPDWEGIYYPGHCLPRLIGPDITLLQRVAEALAKVESVTEPTEWPHETGRCGDDFVSPKRQADEKPRRPRPGPSWREHKGATPYGGAAGIPSRWRPTKPMPLELHQQLGSLLKTLCHDFSWRVGQKLNVARSQLEDWSLIEHRQEEGVDDLYFGGPSESICETTAECLEALTKARRIVERGYDDCKPRRELLATLDLAIAELSKRQAA
ncbi:DUF5623 domain-containing protein [Stenotrophomonas maltophilia]|uniref:DUF5623 domain-containing protein n=1 Tax=Stenotrophomonas TaxID=40323 RepID=UPI0018D29FD3|nr:MULTISPECIES: DUF5623 domain-containing protein [Stenotrophomonas]MBH1429857.1 DUF5623 domain-containing protein [Stenotrophomonas maltophilia]MDH0186163.1 DUF5623 domain-containing protein [Stenotrophomonas sp. GD04051]MDH0466037.1 DUF5623 domain-containing protein [Stenotrophomonas sp. GD03993]MDH0877142.1 DUF5623 domain-containing protein [Stenotrophomonas sp. GD03877]MDH2155563.1 DUF5623 domain-containing protein [Stenotrophomonas sp. GD03657]